MASSNSADDINAHKKHIKKLKEKRDMIVKLIENTTDEDKFHELRNSYNVLCNQIDSEENILDKVWQEPKNRNTGIEIII